MSIKKNIIVVAARRSGTHLLTDLIVNNFGYESINFNYLDYTEFTDEMEGFESSMKDGNKVTWTHSHDYRDYGKYKHSVEDLEKLDKMFSESKIILVYRDVRDIITSCYHRPREKNKYKSFDDFFQKFNMDGYELIDQTYPNIFELLLQYYKNWFSVFMGKELLDLDMEIVSFNDIINNYGCTVDKISTFLEQPTEKKVDVRISSLNEKKKDIIYTTNDFRKGKVGTWVDTIENQLGTKLGEKYYTDLGAGLDCFINDIKINKFHTPQRLNYQIESKNWNRIEEQLDKELSKYTKGNEIPQKFIEDRYKETLQRSTDFRYYHKVFYYKDIILKFIYPCKATLDKKTFNAVSPVASKEILLTVLKTNEILNNNGIVPTLYYSSVHKGVLAIVQERYPEDSIIYNKYKFHPKWGDWKWVVDLDLYVKLLKHFTIAFENNILLTDLFNVYNCAIDNDGDIKYFDLDGIKHFNTHTEMINSEEFTNAIGTLKEVDKHHIKKYNHSLLKESNVLRGY